MLIVVALAPTWQLGVPVAGALLAGLVGLVVLSTHWPHALRPPQNDWLLPYLALAAVACVFVYVVRLRRAAPEHRRTMLLSGAGVLVVVLCLGALIGGRGAATPGSQGDLGVDRRDLLPFPAALESAAIASDCRTRTSVCSEVRGFWSNADGQTPTAVAEQLGQHLRAKGWPMTAGGGAQRFSGCLSIRGLFRWAEQVCASTVPAPGFTWPGGVDQHRGSIVLVIAAAPYPG